MHAQHNPTDPPYVAGTADDNAAQGVHCLASPQMSAPPLLVGERKEHRTEQVTYPKIKQLKHKHPLPKSVTLSIHSNFKTFW